MCPLANYELTAPLDPTTTLARLSLIFSIIFFRLRSIYEMCRQRYARPK